MQPRRYLRPAEKKELWEQQGCQCANPECAKPLSLCEVQWDHVRPLWAGGTNEENWQGLCAECHSLKTREEASKRAKADRQRRYHETGKARAAKGRKLQGRGFPKHLRKKLNGKVERRGDDLPD